MISPEVYPNLHFPVCGRPYLQPPPHGTTILTRPFLPWPEISAKGNTIVIIGSGSGIGRQTAISFAKAGAARIVLLGRREQKLKETASLVASFSSATEIVVRTVDTTDFETLKTVAAQVGTRNVLIVASVHASAISTLASTDVDKWWQGFETNVKGLLLAIKTFLPTANETDSAVLALTSQTTAFPTFMGPGMSGYNASKIAQIKVIEYLAAEQPTLYVASAHPGICDREVLAKSGAKPDQAPLDQIELPGDFLVWMSSPEAAFLKGWSVTAN
ncbi:hypothetical protein VMCG_10599 [Cytospora schulzeri]|uniref:Ketoreductase domain-containing protein n=1 Tax=Cytospora schulzeri TaxID=448051 RepID=A0A423V9P6_9PEZI|nr:hypothetical protein VMCG_10599 [Valsa malicola]